MNVPTDLYFQQLSGDNSAFLGTLPPDSRQRILSEEYASLIFRNENFPWEELNIVLPEYIPQRADWQYAILNAPLSDFSPSVSRQGYFTIPKLFTLLDTAGLESSGISQVQNQPYFHLRG